MLFLCYPKCTTCQRAQAFLESHGLPFTIRNMKEENPSAEELCEFWKASGLPLSKFFNTSGLIYRAQNLREKLPNLSDQEKLALLASDGMLVKRPILVFEGGVLVGFKEDAWKRALLGKTL